MNLEGNHVRSLLHSRQRQNDVELGERSRIMDFNCFREPIIRLLQIETSHAVPVEIHSHTSRVLHSDVHHRVVLNPSQLEALANKGHWILRAGDICCLRHQPSRIVICHRIPMGRHFSLIHLPVRILNLERKIRRKHSGHLH